MNQDKFLIRDYISYDKNFLFSTWINGLYFGNECFQEIPQYIFSKNYQSVIEKILDRDGVKVRVACLHDAKDVIIGYSVLQREVEDHEPTILHWIFVKDSWRKMGCAKLLVPKEIKVITHLTRLGKFFKKKHDLTFNPFA